eukprot:TRINITY_DN771_c5_g1_i1.p1 TRINITY_DN771_c5_g1~~TRINITY_DN771_c5_g1_i1.p1  ORF type:complete len:489 (+),score=110.32 TRINITY_DN771_c5_g1_i1:85-1551(+)
MRILNSPEEHKAYVRQHNLNQLYANVIEGLSKERPDDHHTWVAECVHNKGSYTDREADKYLRRTRVCESLEAAMLQCAENNEGNPYECIEQQFKQMGFGTTQRAKSCVKFNSREELVQAAQQELDACVEETSLSLSDGSSQELEMFDSNTLDGENEERFKELTKSLAIDRILDDVKNYLTINSWEDSLTGINDYIANKKFSFGDDNADSEDIDDEDPDTPDETDSYDYATLAETVGDTLNILKKTIASYGKASVSVDLHVADDCEMEGFPSLITRFKELQNVLLDNHNVEVTFMAFPTKKRRDSYKEITSECRVLMWARICVTKAARALSEEQNFEVFVNLLGTNVYRCERKKHFDHFEVIPSFGQLVNVQDFERHKALCTNDAVVKVRTVAESLHHFKVTLVRVAEHIIQFVVLGEFQKDVARKLSDACSMDEPLFRAMLLRRRTSPSLFSHSRASAEEVSRQRRITAPHILRKSTMKELLLEEMGL